MKKVEVRILDSDLWAIGKLARFLSNDIQDLVTVPRRVGPAAEVCVRMWGRALALSPPSPAQTTFLRQVELFLDRYAKKIWGRKIEPERLKKIFIEVARKSK